MLEIKHHRGTEHTEVAQRRKPEGLFWWLDGFGWFRWIHRLVVFTNLVDFDTVYGHRNDPPGYAANLERFDARLARLLPRLRDRDLFIITADHGNDPTTPSTDHAREHVPVFLVGKSVRPGVDVGTRPTFADLGQTVAEIFGVGPLEHGTSFLRDILM